MSKPKGENGTVTKKVWFTFSCKRNQTKKFGLHRLVYSQRPINKGKIKNVN